MDTAPPAPRRILVAGVSGVGKTTLCREIAQRSGIPHTEIDALFHGPGWTPRPEFMADVERLAALDTWVTEWQYDAARPLLADRADILVWLDLPFWTVTFPRVVRRTVQRRLRREELWNGNREAPLRSILTDPEHIIRWAVTTRNGYRERIAALAATAPHVRVVRLRRRREASWWVAATWPGHQETGGAHSVIHGV
ncbi:AAA family ATPase [Kocuria tytonicola]|uniref:AAA family ATPase n=1 Tax=Kocuria tytonicola TaxID=2055946 RepID=A0A3L9L3U6_9MICC|nr:AAA family ATPase [Kocuria tytonicola]RLY93716.1 AAA family ATPase [Kocuria tytonicola]RLZ03107.1 AAA family ATPase [Kocuria tytonicola]